MTAALYLRVSTEEQARESLSLSVQEQRGRWPLEEPTPPRDKPKRHRPDGRPASPDGPAGLSAAGVMHFPHSPAKRDYGGRSKGGSP